jgi:hypothetical protein
MAEIQFERRGTPLWKVVLGLLAAGAAAFGGYELLDRDAPSATAPATAPATSPGTAPTTAPAAAPAAPTTDGSRPLPPAGARPSPRPTTAGTP